MKNGIYFFAFLILYVIMSGGIVFNSVVMHEMVHSKIYYQFGNCNSTVTYQWLAGGNILLAQTTPENCSYPNAEYYMDAKILNMENEIAGYNQQSGVFAILLVGFFVWCSIWYLPGMLREEESA